MAFGNEETERIAQARAEGFKAGALAALREAKRRIVRYPAIGGKGYQDAVSIARIEGLIQRIRRGKWPREEHPHG